MANPSQPVDANGSANSVVENSPGGTAVGVTAFATDPGGAAITYSLLDDGGGLFAIDATTGVVTVANGAVIDYETSTSHDIVIQATNGIGTSSQTFTIGVVNVPGVTILGLSDHDIIDATHTLPHKPFPTNEEDFITGKEGNDSLAGLGGNDTLLGGSDADTLDGGAGIDSMVGGPGNDTYVVDNAADVVIEMFNEGKDTIKTTLNAYSLAALVNVENLTFIGTGNFTGTGNGSNNVLTGGSGNDTIDGGAGNDTLDGGAGADSMIGGTGNDTFIVDNAGDTINDSAGTDTVKTTLASYTLDPTLENLTFTGAGNFAGTGNALKNTITGGSGNDTLDGASGNDKLVGGAGNDQLLGGAGNDTITGGTGADSMTGGLGADRFTFGAIADFATGPNLDTIIDFTHAQTDKIDVSAIDGNASIAGSTFTFIGAAAFSHVAGQLHYVVNGGGVNVEGDTNGDGTADFTLAVNGVASLVATDFVL